MLVAISIPIFNAQLKKAKYAVDEANARSIYAEMVADYLANGSTGQSTKFKIDGTVSKGTASVVTVTEGDGATNKYNFNGMTTVTFTTGTSTTYPKVTVTACDENDNKDVVFGEGSAATD